MASAISNRYYDRVIFTTRSTMLLVGLVLVMMLVTAVTKNKLASLHRAIEMQDTVAVTAAERTKQLDCLTFTGRRPASHSKVKSQWRKSL